MLNDPTPTPAAPPRLAHVGLVAAQEETLQAPRRTYGLAARVLVSTLDRIYGRRTLSKFKVLELVARVPYQAWEQATYIAITHVHQRTGLARRIHDRVWNPACSKTTSNGTRSSSTK